jgi:hypothetical protein
LPTGHLLFATDEGVFAADGTRVLTTVPVEATSDAGAQLSQVVLNWSAARGTR